MDDIFDKIASAPVYGAGAYITAGTWALTLDVVKHYTSNSPGEGPFITPELTVLVAPDDASSGEGDCVSKPFNFKHASTASNVANFMLAVAQALALARGKTPDGDGWPTLAMLQGDKAKYKTFMRAICSDANPGAGARLRCVAVDKTTRAGGTVTVCSFSPLDI